MVSNRIEVNPLDVLDTNVEAGGGPRNSNKHSIAETNKTLDEYMMLRKKRFSGLPDVEV